MKNKYFKPVLCILAVFVLVLIVVFIYFLTKPDDPHFKKGDYYFENEDLKEGYLHVTDDSIQFFQVDLNELFQQSEIEMGKKFNEVLTEPLYTEEELMEFSDMNRLFVDRPFYFSDATVIEDGNHFYSWYFYYENGPGGHFGLWFGYDSKTHDLTVGKNGINYNLDLKK